MVLSKENIERRLIQAMNRIKLEPQHIERNRLTSLQLVDLLVAVEQEFQFEIDPADYDPHVFSSYDGLLYFIVKTVQERDN